MWSKPEAVNSTEFALNAAKHALEYYEEFFNISYPLPKMGKKRTRKSTLNMCNTSLFVSCFIFTAVSFPASPATLISIPINLIHKLFIPIIFLTRNGVLGLAHCGLTGKQVGYLM